MTAVTLNPSTSLSSSSDTLASEVSPTATGDSTTSVTLPMTQLITGDQTNWQTLLSSPITYIQTALPTGGVVLQPQLATLPTTGLTQNLTRLQMLQTSPQLTTLGLTGGRVGRDTPSIMYYYYYNNNLMIYSLSIDYITACLFVLESI